MVRVGGRKGVWTFELWGVIWGALKGDKDQSMRRYLYISCMWQESAIRWLTCPTGPVNREVEGLTHQSAQMMVAEEEEEVHAWQALQGLQQSCMTHRQCKTTLSLTKCIAVGLKPSVEEVQHSER